MTKPTPPFVSGALPVLGHALEYRSNLTPLLRRGYQEHGPVFALKLANQNVAVVAGPANQATFFLETDKALNMDKPYGFLRAIFGEVAFLASHETYVAQRHILHEPFRRAKMKRYIEIMQEQTQNWLADLGQEGEIEITGAMNRLVQNVAGYALMGEAFQQSVGPEFWALYGDLGRALDPLIPPHWPLPKFRRRDRAKARMIEILRPIIAERRAHPERYDDFLQDFVNARYKDGRELEDDALFSLILGLNFAGHETTAGQSAWTIILLLQNPWYIDLVRAELADKLPYGAPFDAALVNDLDHIAWAVRETERLRPSAEMVMRHAEQDIEFGDFLVPAGWLVQTAAMVAHYLPEWFRDPETYDPLRFAPGREEDKQHRFSLIGFGGGVHKCAGMNFANTEMSIIAALLFQQFDLKLLSSNPRVLNGMGAARPTPTLIHYKRRYPHISPPPQPLVVTASAVHPLS